MNSAILQISEIKLLNSIVKEQNQKIHDLTIRLELVEFKLREKKPYIKQEVNEPQCKRCNLKTFLRSSGECYSCDPM
jgi:hypothetical protein